MTRRTELLDAMLATELETETIFKRALTGEGTIDDDSRERLLNQTKKMDEDTWAILATILDDMAKMNGGWLAVKRHADNSDVHERLRDRVYARINAGILKEKSMKADDDDSDERAAKTTSKPSAAKKASKESSGEPSMEVKLMTEMMTKAKGDVRNLLDVISDRKTVQEIRMSVYAAEKANAKSRKNKEASEEEEMEILVGDHRLSDPVCVEELCFAVEETATAKLTAEAKASANTSAKLSDVEEATNFDNLNRAVAYGLEEANKRRQKKAAAEAVEEAKKEQQQKAKKKAEAKERHEAEVRKAAEAKAKRVADALVRQEAEAKLAAERRAARKAEAKKAAVPPSSQATAVHTPDPADATTLV